ncbi:glycoside hydrolase [Clavulina sp. PMI_390]|nr:glycoside hydrolase [Clavulina sp. PMI_390]
MAYLAKVPSALQTDVTGLKWFKIFEDGFDGTKWGVDRMIAAHGNQTFTIPTCIAPGNYFLRVEMIALHAASSYPGAQFYLECAQINVVGSTGTKTPSTVSFPGAYKGTDPGITINIYYPTVTNYTIPGPAVFKC